MCANQNKKRQDTTYWVTPWIHWCVFLFFSSVFQIWCHPTASGDLSKHPPFDRANRAVKLTSTLMTKIANIKCKITSALCKRYGTVVYASHLIVIAVHTLTFRRLCSYIQCAMHVKAKFTVLLIEDKVPFAHLVFFFWFLCVCVKSVKISCHPMSFMFAKNWVPFSNHIK